jgi:hypothetical protein
VPKPGALAAGRRHRRRAYRYASEAAHSLGWELNLDMSGHRLADFPHAALHQGALAEASFAPSPGLWDLEIQIRPPELPYSAFYDDLLPLTPTITRSP